MDKTPKNRNEPPIENCKLKVEGLKQSPLLNNGRREMSNERRKRKPSR